VVVCRLADPEAKGLVERAHDYLERSFLPGRSFTGPADFNAQLASWLGLANTRLRRALDCSAADRIAADMAAMLPLPPVAPQTGWRVLTRLARDHYVRLDANDYSVHPAVIGRRIEVTADLARVRVLCDGQAVADHERSWAWHQSFTDPAHRAAADALRRQRVAVLRRPAEPEVQVRALADYDTAFGTGGGVA
jgi:transposase